MATSCLKQKNRLQYEKSPYLLQHQCNPVDWYPWGSEAIEEAKKTNKLIFLSVGYSTCHWCHVMERESFENDLVAKIMNRNFVNIKVDREERPDVDRVYMTFVQAVTGGGGWPMSVWMTSDLKPVYGGTYFPPDDRYFGRPGFKALLSTIAEQWEENPEKFLTSSNQIIEAIQKNNKYSVSENLPNSNTSTDKCIQQLIRSYEPAYGGFSQQPKFPQPSNILYLLYALVNSSDAKMSEKVQKMVDLTLRKMALGGIHDHVGKGFARYSTDKRWHVPHFEKMLYDQSQLVVVYCLGYLWTKDKYFLNVMEDILEYVDRDLSHEEGGFYSAEDADSLPSKNSTEKKEGAFYVWTMDEINAILSHDKVGNSDATHSNLFAYRFGCKESGNVDPYQDPHDELKNQNVLYIAATFEQLSKKFGLDVPQVKESIQLSINTLFNHRNEFRPRPQLDSKFVTSWNALMISGFAKAGFYLANKNYVQRAEKGMKFLEDRIFLPENDILRTSYLDSSGCVSNLATPISACVDDFTNMITAYLDLFQATFNAEYIRKALKLQEKLDFLFWDSTEWGYFISRNDDKTIVLRMKDDNDGAEPSSNSIALINIIRFQCLGYDFKDKIVNLLKSFKEPLEKVPLSLPLMSCALSSWSKGAMLIVASDLALATSVPVPLGSLVIPKEMVKELKCVIPALEQFPSYDDSRLRVKGSTDKWEIIESDLISFYKHHFA